MGSSYNAEPMRNSITYQKPTRKIIDVSRRSYDAQMRSSMSSYSEVSQYETFLSISPRYFTSN